MTKERGMSEKTYKVYAINDGTVIDHIPAQKALKVIDILGLENPMPIVRIPSFSRPKRPSR